MFSKVEKLAVSCLESVAIPVGLQAWKNAWLGFNEFSDYVSKCKHTLGTSNLFLCTLAKCTLIITWSYITRIAVESSMTEVPINSEHV